MVGAITYQSIAAMVAAFAIVVVAIPLLAAPARSVGLVDHPGGRKHHPCMMPLTGGLAMFAAVCVAMLMVDAGLRPYSSLVIGMALLLITGLVDDIIEVAAGAKLFMQVIAAVLMVSWGEVQIHSLGDLVAVKPIELGEWAIPFTILCTLVMINAVNMADGTDGLAGGLSAVALLMLFVAGMIGGASLSYVSVTGILLAAVIGFLCFNLRFTEKSCASAFMGDSGSMMLGFSLAWLAVYLSQVEQISIYPVAIAWILVLPVLDVLSLYIRRIRKGRSPFSADREHLHHVLLRSGVSVTATVWILVALMALFGTIGIVGWQQCWPEHWMFLALIPLFLAQYLCSIRAWRVMRALRR